MDEVARILAYRSTGTATEMNVYWYTMSKH